MGGVFICLCITFLCCRTYYYINYSGKIFVFVIIVIYIWGVSVVDRDRVFFHIVLWVVWGLVKVPTTVRFRIL